MTDGDETEPSPREGARLPYLPALDGLRGLAVAAVLLFHARVPHVLGGHLGVSVFFTLSGFLITALLLLERDGGRISLRAFWARRARRLVPAMLLCFALIALVVHLSETAPAPGLLGDAVASMTWVANWRFVLDEQTYADLFSAPSPFQHFWSLAVEEQFYVFFPLLVIALLGVRRARAARGRLAIVLVALIVLSTVQNARLYSPTAALGHAYYGTDARMAELLVGALLAVVLAQRTGLRAVGGRSRQLLSGLGVAGILGLGVAFAIADKGSEWLYRGGFLAVAVATAAVIAAAVQPGTMVARVLSLQPLVLLGVISYGVYLFHWPLFLLLTESFTGAPAPLLLAIRLASTLALAWLSYVLLEVPVRRGVLPTTPALAGWAVGATAGVAAVALAAGVIALPTPQVAPAAAGSDLAKEGLPSSGMPTAGSLTSGPRSAPATAGPPGQRATQSKRRSSGVAPSRTNASTTTKKRKSQAAPPAALVEDPKKSAVPPVPEAPEGALRVVAVGDSIGANLGQGLRIWAQDRQDVVVYNLGMPACPISRGGDRRLGPSTPFPVDEVCGWWDDPDSERRKAFEEFDPQVVVVHDGVNEVFERKLPDWNDWRAPGDLRFDQWLTGEYNTAVQQWTAGGAKVLMVNALCADWGRYDGFREIKNPEGRVASLNVNVYPNLQGVSSADIFNRVCPHGQYTDTVEGIEGGRYDGFHFTPDASGALARNWLGPIVMQTAQAGTGPLQPPGADQ